MLNQSMMHRHAIRQIARLFTSMAMIFLLCELAFGQDPFEIQVYEYETVPKRMWNLETHVNYVDRGTKEFDGPVAPVSYTHLTLPTILRV